MKRRHWIYLILALLMAWLIVFAVTSLLIGGPKVVYEELPSPTPRPLRTDVPEVGFGTATPTSLPTATLRFTFSPFEIEQQATRKAQIASGEFLGTYPIRMAIEELGLLAGVVVVQSDDTASVVVPDEEAGYFALTPRIGAGGNSVIIGHVYPGRVFNILLDAKVGQILRITDENYEEHYYQISEIRRIPYEIGTEFDRKLGYEYIYDQSEERITLVTCYPEYTWTHRFVVRAVPVQSPE